ncbi:uncharacterized protein LOC106055226 [Biomphalaria glabrata]|uniref:Uncharacterized protein LOC106055226 n=1 Tax=Biomphalaria glabrata TaxID=6526 RepID=A0A9W2YVY1_BIOGL|nr:uncharacterized protein LOC106055226 [Biomphalaria glabrata]XP_055866885.1 uncharacterized protein LOC106055226 [Biomphalaria glabrata]XP_055866886.1 uncharacterized protein LOC106055226 [Biomphalaria glabrata]
MDEVVKKLLPNYNQLHLVATKLQILEDETTQLYACLEAYCNKVIRLGSESVKELAKQGHITDDFYSELDKTMTFLIQTIADMEAQMTPVPVSRTTPSSHSSGNQLLKLVTSLQTLRDCQKHLEELIKVYHQQMIDLGNSFVTEQKEQFSHVSQTLETSLVFIMRIRSELSDESNENSRIPLQLPRILYSSNSFKSLDLLLERIKKVEEKVQSNQVSTDMITNIIPQALDDINELKDNALNYVDTVDRIKDLEERVRDLDTETEVTLVKSSIALLDDDVEELKLRFESFLRAFTITKSENFRNFVNIDRRMSDVESKGLTSDGNKGDEDILAPAHQERKLSAAERSHLIVAERLPSVIAEKDKESDVVFEESETELSFNKNAIQDGAEEKKNPLTVQLEIQKNPNTVSNNIGGKIESKDSSC